MTIRAREIYYLDNIFAASATGTVDDAVTEFAATIGLDGYKHPRRGSSLLVREFDQNFDPTDWFPVKVK